MLKDQNRPMTLKQARKNYLKRGPTVISEKERRQLDREGELQERARTIRQAEKRKKENKHRREESKRKEKETRLKAGFGLATQLAGYSHTQKQLKGAMEAFVGFRRDKPKVVETAIEESSLDRYMEDIPDEALAEVAADSNWDQIQDIARGSFHECLSQKSGFNGSLHDFSIEFDEISDDELLQAIQNGEALKPATSAVRTGLAQAMSHISNTLYQSSVEEVRVGVGTRPDKDHSVHMVKRQSLPGEENAPCSPTRSTSTQPTSQGVTQQRSSDSKLNDEKSHAQDDFFVAPGESFWLSSDSEKALRENLEEAEKFGPAAVTPVLTPQQKLDQASVAAAGDHWSDIPDFWSDISPRELARIEGDKSTLEPRANDSTRGSQFGGNEDQKSLMETPCVGKTQASPPARNAIQTTNTHGSGHPSSLSALGLSTQMVEDAVEDLWDIPDD